MPMPKKPRDPETGEPIEQDEANDHKGKELKSIARKLAEERLRRLRKQNKKLDIEVKATTNTLVDLDTFKRQVLAANTSVKNQVFAVIERANVSRETKLALKHAMTEALNDLAYEHTTEPPRA